MTDGTGRVLFVCTGNIFRSLTAEYALRRALANAAGERRPGNPNIVVESAGTEDYPHVVAPIVSDYLLTKGLDVRAHRRRTLTADMLEAPGLIVAMSTEHRAGLAAQFGFDAPLFAAVCGRADTPLPDVEEAIPDHRTNRAAVEAHVRATIDRIIEWTPGLVERLLRSRP